jgi:hypothetical protein
MSAARASVAITTPANAAPSAVIDLNQSLTLGIVLE